MQYNIEGAITMSVDCKIITTSKNTEVYMSGPDKSEGPLPSLFYFALSGKESLCLDPFNQPVVFLQGNPLRVFSLTLPGHYKGLDPIKAVAFWEQHLINGQDLITDFVTTTIHTIDELIDEQYIDPSAIGVIGLSRGSFVATHLAARDSRINTMLSFAPLTDLRKLKEFANVNYSLIQHLDLNAIIPRLINKTIRFYIGNHDTRVDTESCFRFIQNIVNTAFTQKIRSPKVELFITPSIGHRGHGTSPTTFRDGAEWIRHQLLSKLQTSSCHA